MRTVFVNAYKNLNVIYSTGTYTSRTMR